MKRLLTPIYFIAGIVSYMASGRGIDRSSRRVRSYDGAKTVARFGDFARSDMSANAELDHVLGMLRNRARGLFRNDPIVKRWVRRCEVNIVGEPGFRFQSKARNQNGGLDTFGNTQIEELWKDWHVVATSDGLMSFREACKLAVRTWCRDGEVFVEFLSGAQYTHGFALRFFEADVVDHQLNKRLGNGRMIRQGVEIEADERPVAYHMLLEHPGESFFGEARPRMTRRVPADRIIHVYVKERPHQVRGEPPMHAIMTSTKMISGYREAEVTGRRLAASKMGFFKRLFNEGGGEIAPIADTELEDGSLEMEVHPGKLTALPPGIDFEKFDMTSFSTDYEQFERQIMRSIAAGLDVNYSDISMDSSGTSYSTDRSDQIKQRDVWRDLQMFFIERLANKVKDRWLRQIFDFRYVTLPSRRLEKFQKGSYFTPRGWSWVDPQKEIKATIEAVNAKMTSLTRVISEQGRDPEEVFTEIAAERELAKKFGIDITNPAVVGKVVEQNEEKE